MVQEFTRCRVRSVEQPKTTWRCGMSLRWALLIYTGLHHHDGCRFPGSKQAPKTSATTMLVILLNINIMLQPLNEQCWEVVGRSATLWFLDNTLCDVNTLRPRQNGRHFADDSFKRIFLNENVRISIKISLKFVPKGPINNIPALVLIMAWRRPGDKPLSEPMMVSLPTHICVTRPQWVNLSL